MHKYLYETLNTNGIIKRSIKLTKYLMNPYKFTTHDNFTLQKEYNMITKKINIIMMYSYNFI